MKSYVRTKTLIIALILSICVYSSANYCEEKDEPIFSKNCTIFYKICDQDFEFIKCNYKKDGLNYFSSANQICVSVCCANIINEFQNQDDIKNCEISQEQDKTFIILSLLIYSIPIVGLIFLCYITIFCIFFCFRRENAYSGQKYELKKNQQATIEQIAQKNSQEIVQEIQFKENCSICLQPQINCTINCNHGFHLKCILKWATRRQTCPLCQQNSIKQICSFCISCHKKYSTIKLSRLKKQNQYNRILKLLGNNICKQCTKKRIV